MPSFTEPVVVAACIAVAGVAITAWVNARNTNRQLQHDRDQKERDRRLVMRREIYRGLAHAIQSNLNAVTHFADVELAHKDIVEAYSKPAHFLAEMHLVAKPELVRAVQTFLVAARRARLEVRLRRAKVLDEKRRLDHIRRNRDQYDRMAEEFRQQYRVALSESPPDPAKIDRLRQAGAIEAVQRDDLALKLEALLEPYRETALQLWQFAGAEEAKLAKLVVPIVLAARAEVEEGTDLNVYAEVLAAGTGQDAELVSQLFGVTPGRTGKS